MKKIFLTLTLLLVIVAIVWGATIPAPTVFTVTAKAPQNTSLYCTWTLPAHYTLSPPDSSNVIWYSGSDSLFNLNANLTVTATSVTLTGLRPATKYVLSLRLRRGDSTVVSNKDSLFTARANVEENAKINNSEYMIGARSWLTSTIHYDSLYVPDAAGFDSTKFYWTAPYTSIQVKAIGDSCKVLLYVFKGHAEESNILRDTETNQTGKFEFYNTYCDTLNITRAGWTDPKLLNITGGDHFYIRADGQTGNGHTTALITRLYRRDQ